MQGNKARAAHQFARVLRKSKPTPPTPLLKLGSPEWLVARKAQWREIRATMIRMRRIEAIEVMRRVVISQGVVARCE